MSEEAPGSGGRTNTGGASSSSVTLTFPAQNLIVTPSEVTELQVQVTPHDDNTVVTFDILTTQDTPADFDGFLLESSSKVDSEGLARVELQAPSKKGLFAVRASVLQDSYAKMNIQVIASSVGTLEVAPHYEGNRQVQEWGVAVVEGKTCDELDGLWDQELTLRAEQGELAVENVPANTTVAVVLRGDEMVAGCATVTDLAVDSTKELQVTVNDRPFTIEQGTLSLVLNIEEGFQPFARQLYSAIEDANLQMQGEESNDAGRLLSYMTARLPDEEQNAFVESMQELDFVSLAEDLWGRSDPISTQLTSSLTSAADSIPGKTSLSGDLVLDGTSSQFTIREVAEEPASQAGFEMESDWMASRGTGDVLVLAGSLRYAPLDWLLSVFERESGSQMVAAQAQCAALAEEVIAQTQSPLGYDCDQDCLVTSCDQAVLDWIGTVGAREDLATLSISASAQVTVTQAARIAAIDGTWIGRLTSAETEEPETAVQGKLSGSTEDD